MRKVLAGTLVSRLGLKNSVMASVPSRWTQPMRSGKEVFRFTCMSREVTFAFRARGFGRRLAT